MVAPHPLHRYTANVDALVVATQVEKDESRHAQLAWATLKWFIDQSAQTHSQEQHQEFLYKIQNRFEQRADAFFVEIEESTPTFNSILLESYGLLNRTKQRQVHLKAYKDVIIPCIQALLNIDLLQSA